MGIEKLTTSLREEAQREAQAIIRDAESSVERMVSESNAKRVVLLKHAEEEARLLIDEERKERVAWARLEAKRILTEAKEDMIREVLNDFFALLKSVRKQPSYKEFLRKIVSKATEELKAQAGDVIVYCTKEDKALLPDTKAKVVPTLDSFGGAIVESADGAIRVDLTLESLFENKRDELRSLIYKKLFESEEKTQKKVDKEKKK